MSHPTPEQKAAARLARIATGRAKALATYSGMAPHFDTLDPPRAAMYRDEAARAERWLDAHDRCRRCGRALENPESVARHVGPECWSKQREAA